MAQQMQLLVTKPAYLSVMYRHCTCLKVYCGLHVYCIWHAPAQVDEQVNIHTEKNLKVEGEWEYIAQ